MTPGTYNRSVVKNDTAEKIEFTLEINSVVVNLTNYQIAIQIRQDTKAGTLLQTFQIGSGITIINAAAGRFDWDAFNATYPSGVHYYDVQFTDGNGVVQTYITGTFTVVQDVTELE